MSFDTPAKVKQVCEKYNFKPSRHVGQNFLIDKNIISKIIEQADLGPDDFVVEIGPGLGVLTNELSKKVKKVLAIEVDRKIYNILKNEFSWPNVEILNANILKVSNQEIVGHLDADYKIVSNLPYHITSGIIEKFIKFSPKPKQITIMVQREVGDRMLAEPPDMNLLALMVGFYAAAKKLFKVSKNSFWPVPKVDSVITQLCPKTEQEIEKLIDLRRIDEFWALVKAGFRSKRKFLYSNLKRHAQVRENVLDSAFSELALNKNIRSQNLSLEKWLNLAKKILKIP